MKRCWVGLGLFLDEMSPDICRMTSDKPTLNDDRRMEIREHASRRRCALKGEHSPESVLIDVMAGGASFKYNIFG